MATTTLEDIEAKLERFQVLTSTKGKWDPIRARSLYESIEHQLALHALECPEHKLQLRKIRRELKEIKVKSDGYQVESELFEGAKTRPTDSQQSQEDLMKSGLHTQKLSVDSLKRTEERIHAAKDIGVDINQKLAEDTEKIANMTNDVEAIDTTLNRTKKTISRIARKIATDKVVWFFVLLIATAIILLILKKKDVI
jgi:chromosome segregation ATPase